MNPGELAVEITTTADEIEDTTAEMSDTQSFIANLASQCETKKKEWAERQKMRSEEALLLILKFLCTARRRVGKK